ncbi:galactose-specific lectin nattectin-like [Genypterus blacodes]|uniref:galactose-specific lectin nattectin-like n=1 Tax=Genypterus blacodes TaxID=154954 RepID=UPI003F7621DA
MKFVLGFMLMLACVLQMGSTHYMGRRCRTIARGSCGRNWFRFSDRSCAAMFHPKSWWRAKAVCKRHGAQLATVHNVLRNNVLICMTYYIFRRAKPIWIGAKRWGRGWRWADGSRFSYTHWAKGEPTHPSLKCAYTNYRGYGNWKDARCRRKLHFVCIKK